jgi:hypothetical protein
LAGLLVLTCACGSDTTNEQPSVADDAGELDTSTHADVDTGPNQAPVAVIDAPNSAAVGESFDLDGSQSSDPDGDTLKYYWTITEKPASSEAALWGERNVQASITPDVVGEYVVELVVDDGTLDATATLTIAAQVDVPGPDADAGHEDVSAVDAGPNQAPVADAGDNVVADVDTLVTLDGSASSDPDGDALTYAWSIVYAPSGNLSSLLGSDSATPRITPTKVGYYEIELTVSDGDLSSTDSMIIDTGDYPGDVGTGGDAGDAGPDADAGPDPDTGDAGIDTDTADSGTGTDTGTSGDCLIISEYIEGSSHNKALELYNCGSSPIDLTDFRYCAAHNAKDPTGADACSADHDLSGTLAAGGVQVLCHTSFAAPGSCDELTGNVNFNGDDRFAIYLDDGSGAYEHGVDTIVDAFGQLSAEPSGSPWADITLERCNFTSFDGVSSFDETLYYDALPEDDFSGLGVAPSETCAP